MDKVSADCSAEVASVHHILTHRNVQAVVYKIKTVPRARKTEGKRYRSPLEAPLSGLARKAIKAAKAAL